MPALVFLCAGIVLLALTFALWQRFLQSRRISRIWREGTRVLAYVLKANRTLFVPFKPPYGIDHTYAQVVFTLDDSLSDERLETLMGYALGLMSFEPGENATENARLLDQAMKTDIPFPRPIRLPARLTDGVEVYTASIAVYWSALPAGMLTEPYLYCMALVGPNGGVVMIE